MIKQVLTEQEDSDFYLSGNEFVYHSTEQTRMIRQLVLPGLEIEPPPDILPGKKLYKGPDVFLAIGNVVDRERKV